MMKTFLAVFTCAENSPAHQEWMKLDTKTQAARMKKGSADLEQWMTQHKPRILFDGGSLGALTKKVDGRGIHDAPSQMGNFLVIQADSHDEAANLFREHPHFAQFPGDGVEILERKPRE